MDWPLIKFWTRDKFHGANALKRTINPTRVPNQQKESYRWLENVRQRGFASWLKDEPHAGSLRLMDTSLPSPDDIVDEGWGGAL